MGGSGKQSLSRLTSFIAAASVQMITIGRNYGTLELKTDIMSYYMKAGVKGEKITFMMTDSQITDEKFLVYINDLLASGDIPDLFPPDEKEEIINKTAEADALSAQDACHTLSGVASDKAAHAILASMQPGLLVR